MNDTSPSVSETISHLLPSDEEYAPPAVVAASARQKDFPGEYRRSIEDPAAFWVPTPAVLNGRARGTASSIGTASTTSGS